MCRSILTHINLHGLEGFERPVKVFLTCYQILNFPQDHSQRVSSTRATLCCKRRLKIETEQVMRMSYLERAPKTGQWLQSLRNLACLDKLNSTLWVRLAIAFLDRMQGKLI
jgi:hypothetical protein